MAKYLTIQSISVLVNTLLELLSVLGLSLSGDNSRKTEPRNNAYHYHLLKRSSGCRTVGNYIPIHSRPIAFVIYLIGLQHKYLGLHYNYLIIRLDVFDLLILTRPLTIRLLHLVKFYSLSFSDALI